MCCPTPCWSAGRPRAPCAATSSRRPRWPPSSPPRLRVRGPTSWARGCRSTPGRATGCGELTGPCGVHPQVLAGLPARQVDRDERDVDGVQAPEGPELRRVDPAPLPARDRVAGLVVEAVAV